MAGHNRKNHRDVAVVDASSNPGMDLLEPRVLMSTALLGIERQAPLIGYNNQGVLTYAAATQDLQVAATPLSLQQTPSGTANVIYSNIGDLKIHIQVDGAGVLTGGVAGDDLTVVGEADLDGDYLPDVSGVLLTGEILDYGALDTGTAIDKYDFRFQPTGGLLASLWAGQDIGITMTSEHSTFTGDFAADFAGGAKGNLGAVPPQVIEQPGIDITKHGPVIAHAGEALTYTYDVTNPSTVPLSNVTVIDDKAGPATYVGGDDGDGLLEPGELWQFTATTTPAFAFPAPLVNTAVATGTGNGATVTDQDTYTLNPFVLRKALFLYWDSPAYTVPYTVADNTAFSVEAYKGGDLVDTFTISQDSPMALWLSDGAYSFQEVDLPEGYLSAYEQISYDTASGQYPDWTMPNVVTFDLAVDKTGPETAVAGSTITYQYAVTNSGPAKVVPVLQDDKTGTPVYVSGDDGDGLIEAGETWLYEAQYVVPAAATSSTYTSHCCCPTPNPTTTTITNIVTVDDASNPHAPAGQWILGGDTNLANNTDTWTVKVVTASPATGKLSGYVYLDKDKDGRKDCGEPGLKNVTVTLTGVDDAGNAVTKVTVTTCSGYYQFGSLRAGTYTITETQPAGYDQGSNSAGTLGGTVAGDQITRITLRTGAQGSCYNFGERVHCVPVVSCGQTATIGYWQNCNGQALLKSLNGGPAATNLGNWLAATFPNLFGALAGKTNAEIAAFYAKLFRDSKCGRNGPTKFDCQVMAVAFAVYVTDSSLAGTAATRYGFKVTVGGVGICTYSVGCGGAAFGVPNYTRMTVLDILKATDARSSGGQIYNGNTCLRTAANSVYTGINETGDIC